MMPAAKAFDPLLGIDVHIVQPPGPVPPIPVPHPYIGFVFDPIDFVPLIGATTRITGLPRALAGTAGQAMPPHIPIGGLFVKPPSNESEVFMGSAIVCVEGEAMSYLALPVLSCQDIGMPPIPRVKRRKVPTSLVLPTTLLLAIPGPVFIGGPPTISLTAMAGRAGLGKLLALKALVESGGDPLVLLSLIAGPVIGKLQKAAGNALGKLAKKVAGKVKAKSKGKARTPAAPQGRPAGNGNSCNAGNPVNTFTGEYFEDYLDAKAGGDALFEWARHYTTALHREQSGCGIGFRHSYFAKLELFPQAYRFETYQRQVVFFTPVPDVGDRATSQGYVLTRTAPDRLTLARRGEPTRELWVPRDGAPRLVGLQRDQRSLVLEYQADRLAALDERVLEHGMPRRVARYELDYGRNGLIAALASVDVQGGGARTVLVRYEYDPRGQLITSTNAQGGVHTLRYDLDGRVIALRDPRGYGFSWTYDAQGRCVETRGEDGLWWAKLQYFPDTLETHLQECSPGVFIHRFDRRGTLLEVQDPYGGVRRREVDAEGRVVREVDAGGRETLWLYDETGFHYGRRNYLGQLVPPESEAAFLPDPFAPRLPASAAEREWSLRPDARAAFGPSHVLLHGADVETAQALLPPVPRPAHPRSYLPERRYDARGELIEEIEPSGRRRTWEYDSLGNLLRYRDAEGKISEQQIVRWNLLGARTDPLGNTVRFQFTDSELVAAVTDPLGHLTTYEYDQKERLTRVARSGVTEDEYVYDAGDRLIEKRDVHGRALLKFEHDDRALVKHVVLADGSEQFLEHDAHGKPTVASTSEHEVTLERDSFGALLADRVDGLGIELSQGGTVTTYFGRFAVERVARSPRFADSGTTGLVVFTDPTQRTHGLAHDATGLVRRETPAGTIEFSRFDDAGRIEVRAIEQRRQGLRMRPWIRRYSHSAEGDLLAVDDSAGGRLELTWDDAHRLTGERGRHGAYRYTFDAAGNLLEKPGLERVRIGPHNTLLEANGRVFSYDARGHVAEVFDPTSRRTTRYTYNARDLLTRLEVGHRDGETWVDELPPWTAEYDALGRRLVSGREGEQRRFYWREHQLAAELRADGSVRLYVYADERAWVPLFFIDYDDLESAPESGRVHSIFADHLGMPIAVEDAAGRIVWRARRVEPFGAVEIDPSSELELNLRWPGHYYDPETGLHYNRFRYYDPALGRYLQSDPIGQQGGVNVYAYASNPLRDVDLLGLDHDGAKTPKSGKDSGESHPGKKGPEEAKARPKQVTQTKSGLTRTEEDAPAGSKLSNGKPMPPGTRVVTHTDENGNVVGRHYVDPANNNRTLRSEVVVDSPASRKKEGSRPTPVGMESGDHRGHNAPERHAKDQRAANEPENLAAQASQSNLGPKKRHENQLPEIQKQNPNSEMVHVTEHQYPPPGTYPEGDPRNSRPVSSSHGVEIDGVRDPAHNTGPIPNDQSASDYVLPWE